LSLRSPVLSTGSRRADQAPRLDRQGRSRPMMERGARPGPRLSADAKFPRRGAAQRRRGGAGPRPFDPLLGAFGAPGCGPGCASAPTRWSRTTTRPPRGGSAAAARRCCPSTSTGCARRSSGSPALPRRRRRCSRRSGRAPCSRTRSGDCATNAPPRDGRSTTRCSSSTISARRAQPAGSWRIVSASPSAASPTGSSASVASCGASSSTCSASWRRTTRSSASRPARC
jgi:hypothetical protein